MRLIMLRQKQRIKSMRAYIVANSNQTYGPTAG